MSDHPLVRCESRAWFVLPTQNVGVRWSLLPQGAAGEDGTQVGFTAGHYCSLVATGVSLVLYTTQSLAVCVRVCVNNH